MQRRKFLSLTLGALALSVVPASVKAEDYRKSKPTVWTAHSVEDAMENLYGTSETIEEGVTLVAPDVAANGGAVPVSVTSDIDAKSVAIFQDANPESAVCVFDIGEYGVVDFSIKMKMKESGAVTVVVQGKDGKLYSATKDMDVALGGCEG